MICEEYHTEMISNLRSLVGDESREEMKLSDYIGGVKGDSKSIMYDIINAIYDDLESNTDSTSIIKKYGSKNKKLYGNKQINLKW